MNKAEEVFDVILPPIHEATEVMHPCKEPFHFPSSAIAAQAATVLRIVLSAAAVGSDHLDAVLGGEFVGNCFPGFSCQSPIVDLI